MPIIPNNFEIHPNYLELCRKTKNDLQKIENFEIKAGNTYIRFLIPINLIKADFTKGIQIHDTSINLKETLRKDLFKYYHHKQPQNSFEVIFAGLSTKLFDTLM